jgi:MFS family permease
MVVPENLIVPAFLAAVYAFITKRPWWQVAVFAIMAGLVKVTGLLILPILAVGYWLRKERTEALAYVGVTLVAVALFSLLYAASVDIGLYLNAIKNQSSRLIGWGNPAFLLSSPGFHNYVFLDFSYYVMLLLGIGGVAKAFVTQEETKDDEEKIRGVIVLSMVLGWFCTVWVTSAELDMLGWYKIPLFICLSIAAGALASKKYLIPLTVFAAITFFNNFGLIKYPDKQLPEAQVLRFWVALILVGAVGTMAFFRKQLKPALAILSVLAVALMAQSLWVSDQFFAANCKDRTCSTPIVTLKSFVKNVLKK